MLALHWPSGPWPLDPRPFGRWSRRTPVTIGFGRYRHSSLRRGMAREPFHRPNDPTRDERTGSSTLLAQAAPVACYLERFQQVSSWRFLGDASAPQRIRRGKLVWGNFYRWAPSQSRASFALGEGTRKIRSEPHTEPGARHGTLDRKARRGRAGECSRRRKRADDLRRAASRTGAHRLLSCSQSVLSGTIRSCRRQGARAIRRRVVSGYYRDSPSNS